LTNEGYTCPDDLKPWEDGGVGHAKRRRDRVGGPRRFWRGVRRVLRRLAGRMGRGAGPDPGRTRLDGLRGPGGADGPGGGAAPGGGKGGGGGLGGGGGGPSARPARPDAEPGRRDGPPRADRRPCPRGLCRPQRPGRGPGGLRLPGGGPRADRAGGEGGGAGRLDPGRELQRPPLDREPAPHARRPGWAGSAQPGPADPGLHPHPGGQRRGAPPGRPSRRGGGGRDPSGGGLDPRDGRPGPLALA